MDRNQATGLILIALMLILYFQFMAPEPTPPVENNTEETTTNPAPSFAEDNASTLSSGAVADSTVAVDQSQGLFAPGEVGEPEYFVLENEDLKITLSNQGGKITEVELKNYLTHSKEPLILLDNASSRTELNTVVDGRLVNLHNLFYTFSESKNADTIVYRFDVAMANGQTISQIYSLAPQGFLVGYDIKTDGVAFGDTQLKWDNNLKLLEKDVKASRAKAALKFFTVADGFDDFSERSNSSEDESYGPMKWLAFKQHFFTAGILADNSFISARLKTEVDDTQEQIEKFTSAELTIPSGDLNSNHASFRFFFGPNNYPMLKKVAPEFEKVVSLGWFPISLVNKWIIIPLFNFLDGFISNYGIIILILVFVIKLALSPLSYKSYKSMAKTKVLKPELDKIKAEHEGDAQKAQQAQMALYKQVGVNPLSGCIPMLLQMPILFAMFYFFPSSIELRQQPFLWADDLSSYDAIITWTGNIPILSSVYGNHVSLFTLLMTVSTILYTWQNNQVSAVQGPMKSISYMMPVVFMFVLNSFPAALSFYYFVSNIVTFGQQAIIRRFIDEDKIKAILDENRINNKGKKKSKFASRLEQAMKAGEAAKKAKKK